MISHLRLVPLAVCLLCLPARADLTGRVVIDANRNGVADPGEPPRAGIVVSNGREVATTGEDGRYRLPARDGFVAITCPDDFACPSWFRRGAGDFALRSDPSPDDFFFIQISDVHAYPDAADFGALPSVVPSWMPDRLGAWLMLRALADVYAPRSRDEIAEVLRTAVAPYRDVEGDRATTVLLTYYDEFLEPGSELGRVGAMIREALAEVAVLEPRFVISTGDIVLEGNQGEPEAVERWFRFYRDATEALGVPIYNTIGNNEIAGDRNDDFSPDDPRYGKHFFREFYGPTHFSFDAGAFHFAALDTHRPEPGDDDSKRWSYLDMEPEVRDWVDADLAAHSDRTLVVLNHEPFHIDPRWYSRDDPEMANDEGLFAKHRVAYSIAGHVHANGFDERDGTTHITTGALSGFRWLLPAELHPRGYRLFYAKDGKLYSAWKQLGKPVLGFVDPVGPGAETLYPGSKAPADASRLTTPAYVVAVAADASGPFAKVALSLDGEPLAAERWGDYFVRARLGAESLGSAPRRLALRATTAAGTVHRAELELRSAP